MYFNNKLFLLFIFFFSLFSSSSFCSSWSTSGRINSINMQAAQSNRSNSVYVNYIPDFTSNITLDPPINFYNGISAGQTYYSFFADDEDNLYGLQVATNAYSYYNNPVVFSHNVNLELRWANEISAYNGLVGFNYLDDDNRVVVLAYNNCTTIELKSYTTYSGSSFFGKYYEDIILGRMNNTYYAPCYTCCTGSISDKKDIIYFSTAYTIFAIDTSHNVKWQTIINPPSLPLDKTRQYVLNNDESLLFVQNINEIYTLNTKNGTILQSFGVLSNLELATVNGNSELIFAGNNAIYSYSGVNGTLLWSYTTLLPIGEKPQISLSPSNSTLISVTSTQINAISIKNSYPVYLWSKTPVLVNENLLNGAIINSNTFYVVSNRSLRSYSLSTGIKLWDTSSLGVTFNNTYSLVVSKFGSIFLFSSGSGGSIYKLPGDISFSSYLLAQFSLTSLFSIFIVIIASIFFVICAILVLIPTYPTRNTGKEYLANSGIIEFILTIISRKPTEKCVLLCGICPVIIPITGFDLSIIIVQGLIFQLLVTSLFIIYLPDCDTGAIFVNGYCAVVSNKATIFVISFITSIITMIFRGFIGGFTKSALAPKKSKKHPIHIIAYILNFIILLGIIVFILWNYEYILPVMISYVLSIFIDWVVAPFFSFMLCLNCLCLRYVLVYSSFSKHIWEHHATKGRNRRDAISEKGALFFFIACICWCIPCFLTIIPAIGSCCIGYYCQLCVKPKKSDDNMPLITPVNNTFNNYSNIAL